MWYGVRFNNDPEIFKNHRTEINQEINKINVIKLYDNNENANNDDKSNDNNEKTNLDNEINPELRESITEKEAEREEVSRELNK